MEELDGEQAAEVAIAVGAEPDGGPRITITGDLDMSNADRLEGVVATAVAGRPERVVFDLSGLRFLDSAGIAVLLGAVSETGSVQLRDPSRGVRRVLELTGLTDVFAIEP